MTSVAALGFGDIPPEVFESAFELVEDGGWAAFTIKEDSGEALHCVAIAGVKHA
jgi:hypothetical protein